MMKVLAVNGTGRPKGSTTQLTEQALKGASSIGAETEMIILSQHNIQYCRNCLTCYKDMESEISPCPIDDDVTMILERIRDADGVIFSSPVHCGFVTGYMTVFLERAAWRTGRPTGGISELRGIPEPTMTGKIRAVATIVSAGGIPSKLRKLCDIGTQWMKEGAVLCCNGGVIGDMYAGAVFTRRPKGDDWTTVYLHKQLSPRQLRQAYDLGVKLAEAIRDKQVKPYKLNVPGGPIAELAIATYLKLFSPYETVEADSKDGN